MTPSGESIGDLLPARTPLERALIHEVTRLRGVLVWYGNPRGWKEDDWGVCAVFEREYGNPGEGARKAVFRLDKELSGR